MLSPCDMLPGALGLEWGMSEVNCVQRLGSRVYEHSSGYVAVRRKVPDGPSEVLLSFTEAGLLMRMEAFVHMSRPLWYVRCETLEEIDAMYREYQGYYNGLVAAWKAVLGEPAFSGTSKDDRCPAQGSMAKHATCWDTPEGGLMLRWEHQDKELPIMVIASSHDLSASELE